MEIAARSLNKHGKIRACFGSTDDILNRIPLDPISTMALKCLLYFVFWSVEEDDRLNPISLVMTASSGLDIESNVLLSVLITWNDLK